MCTWARPSCAAASSAAAPRSGEAARPLPPARWAAPGLGLPTKAHVCVVFCVAFPLTHHLGGDFDQGELKRPVFVLCSVLFCVVLCVCCGVSRCCGLCVERSTNSQPIARKPKLRGLPVKCQKRSPQPRNRPILQHQPARFAQVPPRLPTPRSGRSPPSWRPPSRPAAARGGTRGSARPGAPAVAAVAPAPALRTRKRATSSALSPRRAKKDLRFLMVIDSLYNQQGEKLPCSI